MSPLEDRLRQAYAEAAQTVSQDDIAPALRRPGHRAAEAPRRRRSVPLLAAAATLAVIVLAVLLTALPGEPPAVPSIRRELHPQAGYFAVLPPSQAQIQIRSAATGRLIAVVRPPGSSEFFSGVAVTGADGRALLVAVETNGGACSTRLYQVYLTAGGRPGPLRPAVLAGSRGSYLGGGFAATSSARAIAYAAYMCGRGNSSLRIYYPGTGTSASWSLADGDQIDSVSLSADGQTLSISGVEQAGFGPGARPGTSSFRLKPVTMVLHATAAHARLHAQPVFVPLVGTAALSPDGRTLYLCTKQGSRAVLAAYNVAAKTRKPITSWTGTCSFALDAAGGFALIASANGHLGQVDLATRKLTLLPATDVLSAAFLAW